MADFSKFSDGVNTYNVKDAQAREDIAELQAKEVDLSEYSKSSDIAETYATNTKVDELNENLVVDEIQVSSYITLKRQGKRRLLNFNAVPSDSDSIICTLDSKDMPTNVPMNTCRVDNEVGFVVISPIWGDNSVRVRTINGGTANNKTNCGGQLEWYVD